MLRELVSADVLEGATLEGRDDEAAASRRGRGPAIPPAMVLEPPLVARATPVAPGAETAAARGEAPGGGGDVVDPGARARCPPGAGPRRAPRPDIPRGATGGSAHPGRHRMMTAAATGRPDHHHAIPEPNVASRRRPPPPATRRRGPDGVPRPGRPPGASPSRASREISR